MSIESLEIEIGIRPDASGNGMEFCHDESGFGYWMLVVFFAVDAYDEWHISDIEVSRSEYVKGRLRNVRRPLTGKLEMAAKDFLYREQRLRLDDHVAAYSRAGVR